MVAFKRVKERNFSYESGRLSKEMQDKLDGVIAKFLEEELSFVVSKVSWIAGPLSNLYGRFKSKII